ncbi:MAG: ARMT1-like domain-containing protein [Spirochaetia bacterium]|nr:ARMT1-like domain-containing protein [Spirochaetia bacterium]
MKTDLDCFHCFLAQAVKAGRMATESKKAHGKIVAEVIRCMQKHKMSTPPPYLGKQVQDIVKKHSQNPDPYKSLKDKYNVIALKMYPMLKAGVASSKDGLLAAVRVAITGNVIDFGSHWKVDVHREVREAFKHKPRVFDYVKFKKALAKAKTVLYIADNSGETVFDRVLIEEMTARYGVHVTYAVKEKPILNDTMLVDALHSGIDGCADIISSGSGLPGTAPGKGTKEFLRIYRSADIIIAKGMGNYELLDEEKAPIFFMLKAKCQVVAQNLGVVLGDMVLKAV